MDEVGSWGLNRTPLPYCIISIEPWHRISSLRIYGTICLKIKTWPTEPQVDGTGFTFINDIAEHIMEWEETIQQNMCSIYDTALYCGLANKLLIQYKAPTHTLSQRIPNCSTTIQTGSVSSIKCGHTPNFSVPNAYTCNRSRLNFSDKFQSSLVLTIRGHLQVIPSSAGNCPR